MNLQNGDKVVYSNPDYDLTLTKSTLSVGSFSELLANIKNVFSVIKEKPIWPGLVFLVWGGLVFINDVRAKMRGSVDTNHPLFKTMLILIGIAWLAYRYYTREHHVRVSTEEGDTIIAHCDTEEQADAIIQTIKQSIDGSEFFESSFVEEEEIETELTDERIKEIYQTFVAARKKCGESTSNLTSEKFKMFLRKKSDSVGGASDFKVGISNGKTVIRPVKQDS